MTYLENNKSNFSDYIFGKVKWYGGDNKKTGKKNKYGFISTAESNEDFYICEKDIEHYDYELKEGELVIFIQDHTQKRKKAIQVQLFSKTKYAKTINLFKNYDFFEYLPKMNADTAYLKFCENDKNLALKWANGNKDNKKTMARMLSARRAEIFAIKIYEKLGYEVKDVSIEQLENKQSEWKIYDICLNGTKKIDVKNATTSINNPKGYSEIYVPSYKEDRLKNEVFIAGVLSPDCQYNGKYLKYYDLCGLIIFLGEICSSEIQYLEKKYSSQGLLELSFSRNSDKGFIAPWLFDYPDVFYKRRNAWRSEIAALKADDFTIIEKYSKLDSLNYFSTFISAGIKLNDVEINKFDSCILDFYKKIFLEDVDKLTLPKLFLLILTEFLEQTKKKPPFQYSPLNYKELLYNSSSQHPLGIYDPLGIISDLIETLHSLWANNRELDYSSYIGFKLTGKGRLLGKLSNGNAETLIAYCGGFEKQRACGYRPLIKGKEITCQRCGRLICPKCKFCKIDCDECYGRPPPLSDNELLERCQMYDYD